MCGKQERRNYHNVTWIGEKGVDRLSHLEKKRLHEKLKKKKGQLVSDYMANGLVFSTEGGRIREGVTAKERRGGVLREEKN